MTATARLAGSLALAALLAAACGSEPSGAPRDGSPSGGAASVPAAPGTGVIADRLEAPWSIAFVGATPLVSERDSGRILEIAGGTTREVGRVAGVRARGEGGLLGIAVREGHLYAYFTSGGDNRIARFPLTGPPGSFALGAPHTILEGIPAAANHNGGRIAFGPDGMLYAGTGDAGDRDSAQDLRSLGGKILRMMPDGAPPADNPFPGSLVYSYGHRNPQGLAWSATGTMYASEFGQNTWDELNEIRRGANYGWPVVEGRVEGRAQGDARRDGFVDPLQQWPPADASPSGIAVVGRTLYIANLRGQRVHAVPLAAPETSTELLAGRYGRLRDVAPGPNGTVWLVTNNTDGRGGPRPGDDRIVAITPD